MSRLLTIVLTTTLIAGAAGCSVIVQTGPQCEVDSDCRLAELVCQDGLCVASGPTADGSVPEVDIAGWVLSYSTSDDRAEDDSLHLAISTDGWNWTSLAGGRPAFGFDGLGSSRIRNPRLFRRRDGGFVLLATDLTNLEDPSLDQPATDHVLVADSADLQSFGAPRLLKVRGSGEGEGAPRTVAAPQAFYDPARAEYGILWAGADSSGSSRIYVTYTADFETVSSSAPLVFFDPGYSVDDPNLIEVEDGYRLAFHDASAGGDDVRIARSSSLEPGSFRVTTSTYPTRGAQTGVSTHTRSPFLLGRAGEWFLYASQGPDSPELQCWSATGPDASPSEWTAFDADTPYQARDGAALGVSRAELDALIEHYGATPDDQRWRTDYSEGGEFLYVAHSLGQTIITRTGDRTSDLTGDSFRWRIVPGLADPDDPELVSFEPVSTPGSYLRIDSANPNRYPPCDGPAAQAASLCFAPEAERHHLAWVEPYVDSAEFRRDATFRRVPALNGDSAQSSFRWLTDESRLLRHRVYHVFATPVDGSVLQNGEASFLFD